MRFTPCRLVASELLTPDDASAPVTRLTFALPAGYGALGLEQPTVHVKARGPDGGKPRTYSLTSEAQQRGRFQICVKRYDGGRMSTYLTSLQPGAEVPFARTLTKRLLAPLVGPEARGRRLGLVAFGVGITECVLTARRAVDAGQHVVLLCAYRVAADVLFMRELCALGAAAAASSGSFQLHLLLSREDVTGERAKPLLARLAAAAGCEGGELPACVRVASGRVDAERLRAVFASWLQRVAATATGAKDAEAPMVAAAPPAFMAVGSKAQRKEAYRLLSGLGLHGRLLSRLPVSVLPALGLAD